MANLNDSSARYVIKKDLAGSPVALASTPIDDILVITSADSSNSSQLWYFTTTELGGYHRMHTEDKGDDWVLDVYNYGGRQAVDLRFRKPLRVTGDGDGAAQYWLVDVQSDETVKFSNNRTGPSTYLDIQDGTSKPFLAARDSQNQRWTLSSLGSTPTPTPSASRSLSATTTPPSRTSAVPSSSCTSQCLGSKDSSSPHKLSHGVIGGIAGGVGALVLLLAGALIWWCFVRPSTKPPQQPRNPAETTAVLHGDRL